MQRTDVLLVSIDRQFNNKVLCYFLSDQQHHTSWILLIIFIGTSSSIVICLVFVIGTHPHVLLLDLHIAPGEQIHMNLVLQPYFIAGLLVLASQSSSRNFFLLSIHPIGAEAVDFADSGDHRARQK